MQGSIAPFNLYLDRKAILFIGFVFVLGVVSIGREQEPKYLVTRWNKSNGSIWRQDSLQSVQIKW